MAGLGRRGDGAAVADRLEDLLEPGGAWNQDRAPGDNCAHIDQDGARDQCSEVEPLEGVLRLEDDDLRAQSQGGPDRVGVTRRSQRCLDPDLGTKVLRDTFTEQRVLIKDHDCVLCLTCHHWPLPRWHVIRTTFDGSHLGVR
jgi:hypothetical protein